MPRDANTTELPNDLTTFLREGRQLEYDADNSEIGRIRLKRDTDLSVETITTFPGCQSIIDDPYSELEGLYQSDVYDLVAESEDYGTEGLLCWIVALQAFGCIDPEHGDVLTFPNAKWADIVANPLPYLEAQWGDDHDVAVRVLPWLHFPFSLDESDVVLTPYGSHCSVHDADVTVRRVQRAALFDVLREPKMDEWFQNYLAVFPYSGVPVSDVELLCCSYCRAAEDAWIQDIDDAIMTAVATPNAHGWVQCPGCGVRFVPTDSQAFSNGIHLNCGQKIIVTT